MDELDEFLTSLGDTGTDIGASSPSKAGEIDLDAEIEELFKSDGPVPDEGESNEEDEDDEEFTITGGENLVSLGSQASPQFQSPPVKALVDKFNNPDKPEEKTLLTPEEKPRRKSQELIPALQERNSDFKIRSSEDMKSYDASNVGKILNSNAETSDAEFLSWLSGSETDGSATKGKEKEKGERKTNKQANKPQTNKRIGEKQQIEPFKTGKQIKLSNGKYR